MTKRSTSGLLIIGCGCVIIAAAYIWAVYTARDPQIVGANIGAGLVGLFGFCLVLVGAIVLVVTNVKK